MVAPSIDSALGTLINSQQESAGKESIGAAISLEQGALDENKINHEIAQIIDKPYESNLVQNVEEHEEATTSKTTSNKTAMTIPPTILESKDTALQKTSLTILKGSVQESADSKNTKILNFTAHDFESGSTTPEIPDTSLHEKSTHPIQIVGKGLREPISAETLQENKSTNKTPQTVGKLSDLVLKTSRHIPMTVSKTETYYNRDSKANSLNVEGLKDDIITLFKSMEEDDGGVQNPTTPISEVPTESLHLENNNAAKAFADLEAYLKMPLKDIVSSESSCHCLENSLKLLSSWSCGNGAPLEGLKLTIDSLLQDLPSILSSFKQYSDILDKFAVFETKDRFLKEELPRRKEAAITLISEISATEESIAKDQLEEADLKKQICRLQDQLKRKENEIRDHEVHLSSLRNKLHEDTIGFKREFETLRKGKSKMVEDQRKAQQELYTANYKWVSFCDQLEQNCKAARNLF